MEQVIINIYSFNELSDEAKQRAINDWREDEACYWIFEQAGSTLDAFTNLFGIRIDTFDYIEMHRSEWSFRSIDDDILALSGLRLQKYIWNNYKGNLFSGKYYSVGVVGGTNENGYRKHKSRKSNCQIDHSCELTGMGYDECMLKPMYDFISSKKPSDRTDFEDLLTDCLHALAKSVEKEYYYQLSDEAIAESIEANELRFLQDGKQFY